MESHLLAISGRPELDAEKAPDWFHAGQLAVWNDESLDVVACAGTQGGKTAIEPYWLLREIQRCAPLIKELGSGKFIYAGPTLTLMQAQAIPAFVDLFEGEHKLGKFISGQKPLFRFSEEGSRRLLGVVARVTVHFAYTNDSSNLESMTALAGVWDEAGQKENKLASYRAFNRRLKLARSKGFGRRLWGTTPYEWGWFKDLVVDKALAKKDGFSHHNWPSWFNPLVGEDECRKELDNGMPLWEWQMMYLGMFTMPAGVIFDCFDTKRNTFKRFEIPSDWPRYVGIDFGNVNTAGIKLAEELMPLGKSLQGHYQWGEPTGRLLVYSIYKNKSDSVEEHAKALTKGEPRMLSGAGGSHQESGWRQAFRKEGVQLADPRPEERGVEIRLQQLYAAIKTGDLVIFDDLRPLIDEIQTMSRELDDQGRVIEKIQDESHKHYVAALSYVVTWKKPPKSGQMVRVGGVGE